jgi:DNA-directed RNA polymerase subunit beta
MDLNVLDADGEVLDLRELDEDDVKARPENIEITPEMLEAQEAIVAAAEAAEQALIDAENE